MNAYPIAYDADYVEEQSRLSTFFRMILAIPLFVFLVFYGLIAGVVIFIAWLALLFTAKYPPGLYNFVIGYIRAASRINGYASVLVDRYPPFSGGDATDYPVRVSVGPPQETYSRLKVFFRFIIGIPTMIMNLLFAIWAELMSIAAWFAIVFTGRLPQGVYEQLVLAQRYMTRAGGYFAYLTDRQPPISDKSAGEVQQPPAPPVVDSPPPPGSPPSPTTPVQ